MVNIINFIDYKEFLRSLVDERGVKRGFQSELAEAAGCQRAYLSQVLRSNVHLTPEHACNMAHFLGLDHFETEYFLTLVDLGRAGSPRLQQRHKTKLERIKLEAESFAKRLKESSLPSAEAQALYYSSWHWGAIHMLVGIPQMQMPKAIAKQLNLPIDHVMEILRGLKSMGLITMENDRWISTGSNLHVPKDSPLNGVNHQNWRSIAVQDSQNINSEGIHYTSAFTVSKQDYEKLKTMLLKFIDNQRSIIGPSACEELVCFTCDLFKP